jgi:beta-1,4-mannooligosaccharide/beta-1,4-mannosyl-N-acetylglucosamine phosphorylase
MSISTIIVPGPDLPNLPWEEQPAGSGEVIWRYSRNPIISRHAIPNANSIFNSAVVSFQDRFAGVFRVDDRRHHMQIHAGHSADAMDWRIEPEPIQFQCDDPDIGRPVYRYDPRVVWLEDRYYVTWCNGYHGPTIGVGYTHDFRTFHQMENAFLPYNRNGVLFPRRIRGKYAMLSRPSDTGHTPFGDIFYSESRDLTHWGCHRFVMGPTGGWQSTKVGAGPVPIETNEGWLLFYHGVITQCNGFIYRFGAALLDLEQPWKVICRTAPYLMGPETLYEQVGDTANVVFPCAALVDAPTGRLAIYYGAADTVTGLAFGYADQIVAYLKDHSEV